MNKIPLYACLLVLFYACHKPQNGSTSATEKYYDGVLAAAGQKFDAGEVPGCFKYIDSCYSAVTNVSESGLVKKYLFIAYLNGSFLHDFEQSNKYTDSAVALLQNSTDQQFISRYNADVHYAKGDASFDAGNYKDAYNNYYVAKAEALAKADTCALSDYNYRLGMVMYKQQHYKDATSYFKLSYSEIDYCAANSFVTFYRKQELINNIALSYFSFSKTDSALVYYNKGLAFIDKEGQAFAEEKGSFNQVAKAVIYGNIAKIYVKRMQYDSAVLLLQQSINVNIKKGNDIKDAQTAMVTLAGIYFSQKDYHRLYQTLMDLKNSFALVNNPEVKVKWNELMWEYYKTQNQPEKGYTYLHDYVVLKDSLVEKKYRLSEVNVSAQLSNMAYQNTIDELKRNETVRKIALGATLVFAVMLFIILCLIIQNARRTKRNVKELTALNSKVMDKQYLLQKALSELETQLKEKDRILRIVAHDLRSPIGGIASLSSLMLETDAEPTPEIKIINEVANDSILLINEILEIAGLAEAKAFSKQLVNINELIFNCVTLLQFKALEKNQKIQTVFAELDEQVNINKEKIARVINNLLSNSIKFSPEHTVIIVATQDVGDGIIISIKDNGIGMPAGAGDKVFDVFTGEKRPGTAGEKSFGLGLSISRQLINDHNGDIWYESGDGGGTTFYVKLYYSKAQK